ncbi:hypothetical protein OAB57_03620, partial [Bacteriovoracaceae bacterium]|nr:hypothetical protein [Bacteriovoracaceae bacterium]
MKIVILSILTCFFSIPASISQDERFTRELITGEIANKNLQFNYQPLYKWTIESPLYNIDLNRDGVNEKVSISKKDGEDWVLIYEEPNILVKKYKLPSIGQESRTYKIRISPISKTLSVLLVYHYQGNIPQASGNFYAQSALFAITIQI